MRHRYLVAYDIREDRRLRAVHRTMKGYGWSMQYSVFVCDLDAMEVLDMKADVGGIIDHSADSVAVVDLGVPEERGRRCFDFLGVHPPLPTQGPVIL